MFHVTLFKCLLSNVRSLLCHDIGVANIKSDTSIYCARIRN